MSEAYRCTARKRGGDFCDKTPVPFAPFPICAGHLTDAVIFAREVFFAPSPRRERERIEREARRAKEISDQSIVYYLREPTGHVKIGYTTNVKARMSQLRTSPEEIMATEPGGRELEKVRHQQFKHLRIGRMETFTMAEDLASHIDMIREHYGPPRLTSYPRVAEVADVDPRV